MMWDVTSEAPTEDLSAYCGEYLREEIAAEALTRNVPGFGRFLEVAALCNGQVLNYQKIASDAELPRSTVQEYFSILKDTLVAEELEPFRKTRRRKASTKSKLYFFDTGVVRYLQNAGEIRPRSPLFGMAFEAWIFHELATWRDYKSHGAQLHFWRSTAHDEVDFVINEQVAIEVKGKERVIDQDLQALRCLMEEKAIRQSMVVSCEPEPRTVHGIDILPWQVFLDRLWDGDLIS